LFPEVEERLSVSTPSIIASEKIIVQSEKHSQKNSATVSVLPTPDMKKKNGGGPPLSADNIWALVFHLHKKIQGLGSLMVNAFIYGMYFEKVEIRTFYMNQLNLEPYRWNSTFHLYKGFFEHKFPIFHEKFKGINVTRCRMTDWRNKEPAHTKGCQVLYADIHTMGNTRNALVKAAKNRFGNDLYEPLSKYMCKKLPRFSQGAQQEVDALIQVADLPKFDVAFHVRRTDKTREALVKTKRYLETYLNSNPKGAEKAEHSFLATDDYTSGNEFKAAMKQMNITCQLWTMTEENYGNTRGREDFTMYLAQQRIMIEVDYFVGMFTSNVGTVVSLFRACPT
jgi:hypothetical protein